MKTLKLIHILIFLALVSCGRTARVKKSEETITSFYHALRANDTVLIRKIYPGFQKLPSWYKSDTINILDYETESKSVLIKVLNHFTNSKGKKFNQHITFYINTVSEPYIIKDSRGLCDFKDNEWYELGLKTGCVTRDSTLTDQTVVEQLERTKQLARVEKDSLISELKKKVPLTELSTRKIFGFLSGSVRMTNNSAYPLYSVRYQLTLSDLHGKTLKSEDGYAALDTLNPGQDKMISFFVDPPKETAQIDIYLMYEDFFLRGVMNSKKWTGNECSQIKN